MPPARSAMIRCPKYSSANPIGAPKTYCPALPMPMMRARLLARFWYSRCLPRSSEYKEKAYSVPETVSIRMALSKEDHRMLCARMSFFCVGQNILTKKKTRCPCTLR
eukprot:Lithocolla_globosa_v1_NODE_4295_length_1469_cov_10.820368.p3 type:complete len:107 gc:universal NODE_4295_length_1469_cov_10.820368:1138-1458(+)